MAAAATLLTHDALLPRPPGGLAPGAALALLAHAGLLLALTQATDWRLQSPEVVSAELWAAVPQVAAPRPEPTPAPEPAPPPPPPPPTPMPAKAEPPPRPDADIAIERAEKRKAEAEKKRQADEAQKERELKAQTQRQAEATKLQQAEAERAAKAEQKRREEARELLADEARLAEQREANLRRMMGQAGPAGTGNPGNRGMASKDAAPSAAYSGRLAALIRSNLVFTGNVPDSALVEVEVRTTASGTVLSRDLVKRSGHADWDAAVLRAIDRTGRLPRDADGRVPPVIIIAFKPRE